MEEALVILLGAILVIWINYLIAREFYRAAVMKGHPEQKYLWLPFFLGVIGYLLVIALPSERAAVEKPVETDELPEL